MTDDQAVPLPPGACPGCNQPPAPGEKWCQQCIYEANIVQTSDPDEQFAAIAALVEHVRAQGAATERERLQHRIDALLTRHNHLPVWLRAEIGKLLDGTP